ncbi:phosphoenolpyruvate--protein phosphotransferase [Fusibacter sp. JL216-2]|uniref:phosphoenolpyruvate--protein phosphotransferase n=1 Tax=Fusibacter sp. JL216-2 TaxID=3071453 RepID=UPI003D3494DD
MMKGTSASPGIAIGKALLLKDEMPVVEKISIESPQIEKDKFATALTSAKAELAKIRDKAKVEMGADKAAIFEAHLMLLEDPEMISGTESKIDQDMVNAEYAFNEVINQFIAIFESMDNDYMRERAADLRDVSTRVIKNVMGIKSVDLSALDEEVVLIAHDLTPSETAMMDKEKVVGFITNIGGRTSHTAIMARSLEIPAVVGLGNITEAAIDVDMVAINGDSGEVILSPDAAQLETYMNLKSEYETMKNALKELTGQDSVTLDGVGVELAGNIGTPKDVKGLIKNDAEGVGLYRTEFIYMDRDTLPTEEEQFESYKKVLESMNQKPVVIRTLDVGGDKNLSYLKIDEEMNPFLGYRAIRLCLDEVEIFKTQLRALLRASVYGQLKIMFPMISSLEELKAAKAILEAVKVDLTAEGLAYSDDIQVGMMIEVPSAAINSDILAKHVDFFSIGTNDLIQYTCAVDRMNEKIHKLYNPFNPAVLRLIKMVIENGHKEGIWVGMCGEMAGDERMIPILLGLGLDEFSMSPISILPARKLIRSLSAEAMKRYADEVLSLDSAEAIEAFIAEKAIKA